MRLLALYCILSYLDSEGCNNIDTYLIHSHRNGHLAGHPVDIHHRLVPLVAPLVFSICCCCSTYT